MVNCFLFFQVIPDEVISGVIRACHSDSYEKLEATVKVNIYDIPFNVLKVSVYDMPSNVLTFTCMHQGVGVFKKHVVCNSGTNCK